MMIRDIILKRVINATNFTKKPCRELPPSYFVGMFKTFTGTKFWIRLGMEQKKRNNNDTTVFDKGKATKLCSGVIFTQWPHFVC